MPASQSLEAIEEGGGAEPPPPRDPARLATIRIAASATAAISTVIRRRLPLADGGGGGVGRVVRRRNLGGRVGVRATPSSCHRAVGTALWATTEVPDQLSVASRPGPV